MSEVRSVNVAELVKFGSAPDWELYAVPEIKDHPLFIAKSVRHEGQTLVNSFETAVDRIKADPDLSATGIQNQITTSAETHLKSLGELRERMGKVEAARGEALTKAKAGRTKEDKFGSMLLENEIRRLLHESTKGDALAVRTAYVDALGAGDYDTLDAIENAPRLFPGIPDDIDALKERRLETEDPRLGEEVQRLTAAVSDTTADLDLYEGDIRAASGLREDDPLDAISSR
jgi:hypothetical protein